MEATDDTGDRLDQCGGLHGHVFGDGIDNTLRNGDKFGESTGVMSDTNRAPALAEISHSALTVVASTAVQRRVDPYAVADRKSLDVLTDRHHFATEFVADDDGIDGRREFAVDDMDVSPTDTAGADPQNDVVRAWFRFGDIDDSHLAGLINHDRFHDVTPELA